MNKYISWVALTVGVIALVVGVVGGNSQPQSSQIGASGTRFPNGLSADSTSPSAGEVRGADLTLTDDAVVADDLTVNGRTITNTTSNTSTSTYSGGCIQTTATSTASPVRFVLQATTTVGNATQGTTGTNNFVVLAQFGTCPI